MSERSPSLTAGRPLGRYVVARRLGTGGFARVYKAHDPELEIDVAIKVLLPHVAVDPAAVERFRREAMTAARLRHPSVVTVLTVGRLDESFDGAPLGTPYLVMDYLPESLAARVAAEAPLPEAELRRIGSSVARGLAYAHREGVVHRDVKPDNVLFARDGRAIVTDFGIARALGDARSGNSRSVVLGTPSYFSPEQARGLPLDGRTDIYALGVTLYQGATGVLPFEGDDWYTVMRCHVEDPPEPPRSRNPALTPEFEQIVLRCLAKDPADRFPDADLLADALDGLPVLDSLPATATLAVDALPTGALRPVPGRRMVRPAPSRRRWVLVGGALALTVAASAGALTLARFMRQGSAAARLTGTRATPPASGAVGALPGIDTTIRPTEPPAPQFAGLMVSAPDADLSVDGIRVAHGAWTSDSLTPGRHELRARVASLPGCTSADTTMTVSLLPGERRAVRLRPVACGQLALEVEPTPAHFVLTPARGGPARQGNLPLTGPLVVPEGTYRLEIEARLCAPYKDDVRVPAGAARSAERIKLICGLSS